MQNFKIIMSVTSSATASGDQEVPSTDIVFRSRLCLVTITKRDDTPMGASSISEEDIMEMCIKKGHTHLLGVFHYSATESVVLFHTTDELMHASDGIVELTELQDEAITVRAMAPLEAHITTYMTVWCLKPSKGDGEPHTPPQQTPPSGGTPYCLQADLSDLADHELQQLVEELHPEITQCGMNAPPSSPPPSKWACPSVSREPKEDDQEVTFPGGGRWGPLKQPTPAAEQPAGRRVPSGPLQQTPCPALAGSDMGQLITTLTSGLCIGTPKINTFSGDISPGKTEVSYEQWNHKVQCIKDHYPESVVWKSIMRSLKGAVADMVQYMGPTAGVSDILEKLLVIFGTIASFDVLMQNFYKITQGSSEKVPSFSPKLEGTLN